jgi:hypothetical protein
MAENRIAVPKPMQAYKLYSYALYHVAPDQMRVKVCSIPGLVFQTFGLVSTHTTAVRLRFVLVEHKWPYKRMYL